MPDRPSIEPIRGGGAGFAHVDVHRIGGGEGGSGEFVARELPPRL